LSEGYLSLEIAPGVEVQLQRSAIVQVLPKGAINTSK
jgi:preprotein translocase subunit YajC